MIVTNALAAGTSLVGYVHTTYDRLVDILGEPRDGSADGKTTASWTIKFEDGSIATIYDWKQPQTPTQDYQWHIGGFNSGVVERIGALLEAPAEKWSYLK